MRGGRRRFAYSLSEREVVEFGEAHDSVKVFLSRYAPGSAMWLQCARGLAMFFSWLKIVKGLDLFPDQFLNQHLRKRASPDVSKRRWGLQLALDFSKRNRDLDGLASSYVYNYYFLPLKLWCDSNEAPLTTARAAYGKIGGRKFVEPVCMSEKIRQVLSVCSQRDRSILMTQLQSGQSIKQVLVDMNSEADRVFSEIDNGAKRIRFDFPMRKGNNFPYFTFIGPDAIQELQKWHPIREAWLRKLGVDSPFLFITHQGKKLRITSFLANLQEMLKRHKLWTGPYTFRTHMLRKFFESEASEPDRGISRPYVAFMMGHKNGVNGLGALDSVGGVYDRKPQMNPKVVEREYAKLLPYLNIYSQRPADTQGERISDEDMDTLKELLEKIKKGKVKIEP